MFIVALAVVAAIVVPVVRALRNLLKSLPTSNADFSPF